MSFNVGALSHVFISVLIETHKVCVKMLEGRRQQKSLVYHLILCFNRITFLYGPEIKLTETRLHRWVGLVSGNWRLYSGFWFFIV